MSRLNILTRYFTKNYLHRDVLINIYKLYYKTFSVRPFHYNGGGVEIPGRYVYPMCVNVFFF